MFHGEVQLIEIYKLKIYIYQTVYIKIKFKKKLCKNR